MPPVTDHNDSVIDIVTDRDISIAMGAGDITVGRIALTSVLTCKPDDEIHEALSRWLTIACGDCQLSTALAYRRGFSTMDDIISHGHLNKWEGCRELSGEEIIRSLKRLFAKAGSKARAKAKAL